MDQDKQHQEEHDRLDQQANPDSGWLVQVIQLPYGNFKPVATDHQQVDLMISGLAKRKKRPKPEFKWREMVEQWEDYIGDSKLQDWQRLCWDLTLEGDFGTYWQCEKVKSDHFRETGRLYTNQNSTQALKSVWVNICDFLKMPEEVALFESERHLKLYTLKTNKIFPLGRITNLEDSPLESLLAYIHKPRPPEASTARWMKRRKGRRANSHWYNG